MKLLFIEARKKVELDEREINKLEEFEILPENLHILYTIQYKDLAEKTRNQLKKQGKKILAFQQVLGCSKINPRAPLLFVGSGKFHALQLALPLKKEIFIYDNGKISKIGREEILNIERKEKGKIAKFLSSTSIGLIVSKKPGQSKLKEINKIKQDLENKFKNKKFYLFLADTLDLRELENFPVDFFINTSCPGIELDSNKILNYEKVLKIKI